LEITTDDDNDFPFFTSFHQLRALMVDLWQKNLGNM